MKLRTPFSKAMGLGSAKEGVSHWWSQRLSAIALIPLTIWLVSTVVCLAGANYETVIATLQAPINATLLILFIATAGYHGSLGVQVVIEDYVNKECTRIGVLIATKFAIIFLTLLSIVSVFKFAFGG